MAIALTKRWFSSECWPTQSNYYTHTYDIYIYTYYIYLYMEYEWICVSWSSSCFIRFPSFSSSTVPRSGQECQTFPYWQLISGCTAGCPLQPMAALDPPRSQVLPVLPCTPHRHFLFSLSSLSIAMPHFNNMSIILISLTYTAIYLYVFFYYYV